ncbi:MAG: beta-lactamase family protein [Proteobacteria bacterium]|nr:beta-lactamase family protein [Pseudomonadota bacterium]
MTKTRSLFVLALALMAVRPGAAEVPAAKLRPAAIEKWADDVFGQVVKDHRVSGLGFTVIQGDKVLFMKGYGYQDVASRKPFDPTTTQTRIASTTKQFIGVSVAQLLERGKIASLNDPVNKYLKRFQLPKNNGEDVLIWDLLTHRGGFAGNGKNLDIAPETTKTPLSADIVKSVMPDFWRKRDSVSVYCNICSGVLGFMIEDITGQGLPDYLRDNIYKPLGMTNTELAIGDQPPPNMAVQYAFVENGVAVPLPYPTLSPHLAAAGSNISTTADMSKWLIANIMEGNGTGKALLNQKTWDLVHTQYRQSIPGASGFGMHFFTYDYNGERLMEQYGSLQHYSMFFLMPDSDVGIFMTLVGGGAPRPDAEIPKAGVKVEGKVLPQMSHAGMRDLVLSHFLGTLPYDKNAKVDLARYTGLYNDIPRQPQTTSGQVRPPMEVKDSGDGGLIIDGRGTFRPSGPNTFTLDHPLELDAGFGAANRYIFKVDASGKASEIYQHVNAGRFERAP